MLSTMEVMQFLSVFSIVNLAYIPDILQAYYRVFSIAMLQFLPNIFDYVLPLELNPVYDKENALTESYKNHPYIFFASLFFFSLWLHNIIILNSNLRLEVKNFLYNIGNVFSVFALMILAYILIYLLSKRCTLLVSWKTQYERTGIYCGLLASFPEIFLSACLQMRYVLFAFENRKK